MKTIVLIGMPGAGKSTVGVLLAKELGMDFVDTDILIQLREGRALQEIIHSSGYLELRRIEEKVVLENDYVSKVVATGGSVVYSAMSMAKLNTQGIYSVADLLMTVPRRYLDRSQIFSIGTAPVGEEVTVSGTVTSFFKRRKGPTTWPCAETPGFEPRQQRKGEDPIGP